MIATYWDIVTLEAEVSIGLGGAIFMSLTLQPLPPAFQIELDPTVIPELTLKIMVDLLWSVAKAGADVTSSGCVTWPFAIDANHSPKPGSAP